MLDRIESSGALELLEYPLLKEVLNTAATYKDYRPGERLFFGAVGTNAAKVEGYIRSGMVQVSIESRSKLNEHLEYLLTRPGLTSSELNRVLSQHFKVLITSTGGGNVQKSILSELLNVVAAHYETTDGLLDDIDLIPKDLYKEISGKTFSSFCSIIDLQNVGRMSKESLINLMFSYALTFMSFEKLIELILAFEKMNEELINTDNQLSIPPETFVEIVESFSSEEWQDYPTEWTLNVLVGKS